MATPETPTFRLVSRTASPGLLELPWQEPLEEWTHDRLVEVARGIHRHVVRFVELGGSYFALKELPARLAWREYRLLTELEHEEMPVVTPIGVVADRHAPDGEELEAVLITRYLEFSLPYRLVLARRIRPAPRDSLLDALVQTLVRLHLVGFFWGDCSLSNLLFRRDAGALSAYLVDAETGELHERLSDGQRGHDLDIAEENVIGELYDVAAELGHEVDDPFDLGAEIRKRYEGLWAELTDEEVFSADESFRVEDRLRRLNELGFDAEEVEVVRTPEGYRLRLHSRVVEPGHHRRRLLHLTGLQAQENQARRLLNDITTYGKWLERRGEKPVSEAALAGRWLSEVFEPAVMSIPPELHGKLEAAELFHELLEHRWFLSEQAGKDVGMEAATQSYVDDVLRAAPEEKAALLADDYPTRVENTDDGA